MFIIVPLFYSFKTLPTNYSHCLLFEGNFTEQIIVFFQFTPSSGAIYGNMVLKIEGRDLGTMSNDVNNITVAGTACHYLTELYEKSKT